MMKLFLLGGAAAMAVATPALAKPGLGNPHGNVHATGHGNGHSAEHGKWMSSRTLRDRDRDGIDDRDEALARRYGGALCPPGLWKKTPSCVPPGQAKRMFHEGQRLTRNYRYYTPYANIPFALRDQYDLSDDYRYVYRDNVIYVVDPTTRLVQNIINAVL